MKRIILVIVSLFIIVFSVYLEKNSSLTYFSTSLVDGFYKKEESMRDGSSDSFDILDLTMDVALASYTSKKVIPTVLESRVGNMSSYGPDCVGCSGILGAGYDVRSGNYWYSDPTYGDVRIVAGDPSYPYGTIVMVKSSRGDFIVIVLDRGGDIGIGRRFLFDLLFSSEREANSFGTTYNATFEILRYGY